MVHYSLHFSEQMNLTDGCVTQTLDYQPDYAENNTIERGIITKGSQLVHGGQCSAQEQNYTCEIEQ